MERVEWRPADALPERRAVLALQGVPSAAEPSPRILAIVESAEAAFLESAEPRALVAGISREAFADVFRGEGWNAAVTPIEAVTARADALALFVATVGGRVTERTRALFARNEPALAAMLDSVASAAADGLSQRLAARFLAAGSAAGPGRVALGYSPGYCGWHVTGQRALFAFIGPEAIGVTLNASCLMDPLKSVSGVLAAGPADIHRFTPAYAFCEDCRTRACVGRIRALPDSATAG
jgi:hypothetical protein